MRSSLGGVGTGTFQSPQYFKFLFVIIDMDRYIKILKSILLTLLTIAVALLVLVPVAFAIGIFISLT